MGFLYDMLIFGSVLSIFFYFPLKDYRDSIHTLLLLAIGLGIIYFMNTNDVTLYKKFIEIPNMFWFFINIIVIYLLVFFVMRSNDKKRHYTSVSYNVAAFVVYNTINITLFKGMLPCPFFLIIFLIFSELARQTADTEYLKRKGLI